MKLWPIERRNIDLVAGWLSEKANYQWLDFGNGSQILTPVSLRVMTQKEDHLLRLFTPDSEEAPIGVVALSHLSRNFKTAMLWYLLGDKRHSGKGYTTRAVAQILGLGFRDAGLQAINAWAVEQNTASIRILERYHFKLIGRQRQCHYIDGQAYDRLLFDLLASEYKEL